MKRTLLSTGNRVAHDGRTVPFFDHALAGSNWIAVDCGAAFEDAAGIVSRERPDLLVIVDAATMDTEPGTFCRPPIDANDRLPASTHGLPPAVCSREHRVRRRRNHPHRYRAGGLITRQGMIFGGRRGGLRAERTRWPESDLDEIPKDEFRL